MIPMSLTRSARSVNDRWSYAAPIRTIEEVAAILGMTKGEVRAVERRVFRKIKEMLPPCGNRLEAARAVEVSYRIAS